MLFKYWYRLLWTSLPVSIGATSYVDMEALPVQTHTWTFTEAVPYTCSPPSTISITVTQYIPIPTTQTDTATASVFTTEATTTTATDTTAITSSVTLTASEELVVSTATSQLTSITLCPTRTINPTFKLQSPLPTDWTWGCPPGWLCKPERLGCNFEAGLPGANFYCAPNECILAEALPTPLETWDNTVYGNSTPLLNTSLKVNAIDSYFNAAPPAFGLTYEIFVVNEVFTFTSTAIHQPTPVVGARQAETNVPGACYPWCNNCLLEAQSAGKTPALCQPGSAFEVSLSQCEQCIKVHSSDGSGSFVQIAPQFQQFLDYCDQYTTVTVSASATETLVSPLQSTVHTTVPTAALTAVSTGSTLAVTPTVSTGASGTTYTGTALAQVTIILPVGVSNATTLAGSNLSGVTIIIPGVMTTTVGRETANTSHSTGTATSTVVSPASSGSSASTVVTTGSSQSATPSQFNGNAASGLQPSVKISCIAIMGWAWLSLVVQ